MARLSPTSLNTAIRPLLSQAPAPTKLALAQSKVAGASVASVTPRGGGIAAYFATVTISQTTMADNTVTVVNEITARIDSLRLFCFFAFSAHVDSN